LAGGKNVPPRVRWFLKLVHAVTTGLVTPIDDESPDDKAPRHKRSPASELHFRISRTTKDLRSHGISRLPYR